MLTCFVPSAWTWWPNLSNVKTVASCSAVRVLRRMGGSLVQAVGWKTRNTSRMPKVSQFGLSTKSHFGNVFLSFDPSFNLCLSLVFSGRREISELQVRCANTERGCQWTGTVGTLDNHTASCQFDLVHCPNKCEEDSTRELLLIRKDLVEHLATNCRFRAFECPFCMEKGTFAIITEDHDRIFKKIIDCPNKAKAVL